MMMQDQNYTPTTVTSKYQQAIPARHLSVETSFDAAKPKITSLPSFGELLTSIPLPLEFKSSRSNSNSSSNSNSNSRKSSSVKGFTMASPSSHYYLSSTQRLPSPSAVSIPSSTTFPQPAQFAPLAAHPSQQCQTPAPSAYDAKTRSSSLPNQPSSSTSPHMQYMNSQLASATAPPPPAQHTQHPPHGQYYHHAQQHHSPESHPASPQSPIASTPASSSATTTTTTRTSATSPRDSRRKHVCKVCSRSFTTSGHLARHNRIHTGERRHECPWPSCDARFARQDNCMQHYKTHTNGKNKRARSIQVDHSNLNVGVAGVSSVGVGVGVGVGGFHTGSVGAPSLALPFHHPYQPQPPHLNFVRKSFV